MATPTPGDAAASSSPPILAGPYRLGDLLGAGSSGEVYQGERMDFSQRVAVKLFHPLPGDTRPRLPHTLDHPNIVRLLDTGRSSDGRFFLSMELVAGEPLDLYCDRLRLALPERLGLLLQLLDAVEFAHRHLVLHGDLKPSNILVDRDGQAKLVDFRSASPSLRSGAAERPEHTPLFASPETRLGHPASVASDVYSLGLIARLLLSGLGPAITPSVPMSVLLQRTDATLAVPLAARQRSSSAAQRKALRGDLNAIVAMALRPQETDRYAGVEALSADLRNFLAGRPVSARRARRLERLSTWAVYNRGLATVAVGLALVIALGSSGVFWQAARATRERRATEARLRELVQLTGALEGTFYTAAATVPGAGSARDLLLAREARALDELAPYARGDRTLGEELSSQYARLAALQLRAALPQKALRELDQQFHLLQALPRSPAVDRELNNNRAAVARLLHASGQ